MSTHQLSFINNINIHLSCEGLEGEGIYIIVRLGLFAILIALIVVRRVGVNLFFNILYCWSFPKSFNTTFTNNLPHGACI